MLELIKSYAAFQAEVKNAVKDSKNPHFNNRYASLGSVIETVRPALAKHGLVFTQTLQGPALETRIIHVETGQEIVDRTPIILSKQDMQPLGSAITYARRYGLSTICGIVSEEDDDANGTNEPDVQRSVQRPAQHVPLKAPSQADKVASDVVKKNLTDILGFKKA